MQKKIKESSDLAKLAISTWRFLYTDGYKKRAVTVTALMTILVVFNKYQIRQLQHMMLGMGLLEKRDNGRFYLVHKPSVLDHVTVVAEHDLL